ncbi:hypothetical protein [Paenibacillus sp. FSL H7-0331]|uniref:hypothetical protein n=1 Tax=Paenibacillus sp. FSL H7-0331 TaxID=1920421 RepID=UPI00096EA865|nr:hypothetical protein [Paenibacillus sp. FSL H7-0331]OME93531.1 hypothetical protein BK127_41720 [Paenibacillus sp. FSL H7-0331]
MPRILLITVVAGILAFMLIACSMEKSNSSSSPLTEITLPEASLPETTLKETIESNNVVSRTIQEETDREVDNLVASLKLTLNDDMWYKGENSLFKALEGQSVPVELYKNPKNNHSLHILFATNIGRQPSETSFISLDVLPSVKGYSNEISNYILESDADKLKDTLHKKGYSYYKKTLLKIEPVSKPIYPSLTASQNKQLNSIEKIVFESLDDEQLFHAGVYKLFIRNFRGNDYKTKVVIEDQEGKQWVHEISLSDDGKVGSGKIFSSEESKGLSYQANQFKQNMAAEKTVTIKHAAKPESIQQPSTPSKIDVNFGNKPIVYRNEQLGFEITFPESWKNKYEIVESSNGETGMTVFYQPTDSGLKKAELFQIYNGGTEVEWNNWWNHGGKDKGVPFEKLGVSKGQVVVIRTPTEMIYKGTEEEKEAKAYVQLLHQIDGITGTFSIIKN